MESQLRNVALERPPIFQRSLESLFPRFCVRCRAEGSLWCHDCDQLWSFRPQPPACAFCGREGSNVTCLACRPSTFLDGLVAFGPYANPIIRSMLRAWKYVGDQSAEETLKKWLFVDTDRLQPPILPFSTAPIALHKKRRRVRGFDQAEILAGWIESMYGLPIAPLLQRSTHTTPQAQVHGTLRKVGELDEIFELSAFAVETGVPSHVLLCDDVFTSGATMDAAAQVIKQAGAKTVWGFVIAKGI